MIFDFFSAIPTWAYFIFCVAGVVFALWSMDWQNGNWKWLGWIVAIVSGLVWICRFATALWEGICGAWIGFWGWAERNHVLALGILAFFLLVFTVDRICDTVKYLKRPKPVAKE